MTIETREPNVSNAQMKIKRNSGVYVFKTKNIFTQF